MIEDPFTKPPKTYSFSKIKISLLTIQCCKPGVPNQGGRASERGHREMSKGAKSVCILERKNKKKQKHLQITLQRDV